MTKCTVPVTVSRATIGPCESCGVRGPLEHHVDPRDDVRAMCRDCHRLAHRDPAGMVWHDVAEMAAHWEPYYAEMERD